MENRRKVRKLNENDLLDKSYFELIRIGKRLNIPRRRYTRDEIYYTILEKLNGKK